MTARTIFVGDVHGCRVELEALLERVRFGHGDRLVLVGDLIARGPDSLGVLSLVRRLRAAFVRGNHEDKLVRWRAARRAYARGEGKRPKPLGDIHAEVARTLRRSDWAMLEASPLWLDLPRHGVRVVHAGVVPGVAFEDQERRTLLRIRTVTEDGEPAEKGRGVLWGARYKGPPHIVFGHNAGRAPQLHRWATGLDTSCVYGGRLTALVLGEGESVPRDPRACRALLVSVPARRAYYEGIRPAWAMGRRRVA
jgi:hypothetical protein